ncbi:MAG: RluA family pseudouridine synthase [Stecheria intestinalis]|nr:RluA family pseudouridine synthase [Stecheria intestinalis]
MRIKDLLIDTYSRRELSRLHTSRSILLNGQPAPLTAAVLCGDVLETRIALPEILYEDEDLVILDKPAGLSCHPEKEHPEDNLGTMLKERYGPSFIIRTIGRLDREVSGIMIYARNAKTARKMETRHLVQKHYLAIASGVFPKQEDTLFYTMEKKKGIRGNSVSETGKPCITHYQVLHQYPSFALLRIAIRTGRTHQIRSGLSAAGHPLLGDRLYGGDLSLLKRPALHCAEAEFRHPRTAQLIKVKSELPRDMQSILSRQE